VNVFYTEQAIQDLVDLKAWLYPRSHSGFRAVSERLDHALEVIKAHPSAGRQTSEPDVREVVEPRYGFVISYLVDTYRLIVMRIYNGSREPRRT
jgi:plasmid stabilization system protein ParE